jgi:hypothetical protein
MRIWKAMCVVICCGASVAFSVMKAAVKATYDVECPEEGSRKWVYANSEEGETFRCGRIQS